MNTKILKGKNFPVRTTLKNEPESGLSVFGFGFFVDREEEKRQLAKREDDARYDESRYINRVNAYKELSAYTHHIFMDTNILLKKNTDAVLDRLLGFGFTLVISEITRGELTGLGNDSSKNTAVSRAMARIAKGEIVVVGENCNRCIRGSWGEKIYELFTNAQGIVQTSDAIKSFLRDRKIEIDALEYINSETNEAAKLIFVSEDKDMTDFVENNMAWKNREEDYKKLTFIGLEKLLARIDYLRSII